MKITPPFTWLRFYSFHNRLTLLVIVAMNCFVMTCAEIVDTLVYLDAAVQKYRSITIRRYMWQQRILQLFLLNLGVLCNK